MNSRRLELLRADPATGQHETGVLAVDDSGDRKDGTKTAHVGHQWLGGCDQPASACEVHHLTHKADGGKTSVQDCALFCTFHHQVVIHLWGWTVVLNPDGTTTAGNKDKTKILHSHGPPARPG